MTALQFFDPKRIALAALGSLLYFGVPWPSLGAVGTALGPPLFLTWTIVVPGRTVAGWLEGSSDDALEATAGWVLFGLATAMSTAFVWALALTLASVFSAAWWGGRRAAKLNPATVIFGR